MPLLVYLAVSRIELLMVWRLEKDSGQWGRGAPIRLRKPLCPVETSRRRSLLWSLIFAGAGGAGDSGAIPGDLLRVLRAGSWRWSLCSLSSLLLFPAVGLLIARLIIEAKD